jgi:hypothetical protein
VSTVRGARRPRENEPLASVLCALSTAVPIPPLAAPARRRSCHRAPT